MIVNNKIWKQGFWVIHRTSQLKHIEREKERETDRQRESPANTLSTIETLQKGVKLVQS